MSEETPTPEEKAKLIDPEVLRQQAEEIRQSSPALAPEPPKQASRWVQGVYVAVLVLVIASVFFLLVSREGRLRLLKGVAHAWSTVSSTEATAEVFKLPAPPPKTVEPKVVLQGSPTFVFRSGQASPQASGASESAETGESESATGTEDESQPPPPPEKTTGSKAAYELLVKNSEVARKLTTNAFPDLQFKEWKPVKNSPPEFWINIVAAKAGQNVEFVWMVNTESGTVTPLSQNARDLQLRK